MTENEVILRVDPSEILADDNSRFGILDADKERMKDAILSAGEIHTPVQVSVIEGAKKSEPKYRLIAGFIRHAAAVELNKEQNAGVLVPLRIVEPADDKARLLRQLSENVDRANQTPMDIAVAIGKLFDAGVSRAEIRKLYARPSRQKGAALVPASNAWINIMHNLLQLPKTIQQKIHSGAVGVEAAYVLGKVNPDKRAEVLARAEAEIDSFNATLDKDENAFLKQEAKVAEVEDEAKKAATDKETVQKEIEVAQALCLDKKAAYDEARQAKFDLTDKDAMAKAVETVKAAEADLKGAEKALKQATTKLDRLNGIVETKTDKAAKLRKNLEAKRAGKKPVSKKKGELAREIKKQAAATEGAEHVPLNATEIRKLVTEMASGAECVPRVAVVGQILKECFDGVSTPKQMIKKLTDHVMKAGK